MFQACPEHAQFPAGTDRVQYSRRRDRADACVRYRVCASTHGDQVGQRGSLGGCIRALARVNGLNMDGNRDDHCTDRADCNGCHGGLRMPEWGRREQGAARRRPNSTRQRAPLLHALLTQAMSSVLPSSLAPHVCILPSPDLVSALQDASLPPIHQLLQSFSPLQQGV